MRDDHATMSHRLSAILIILRGVVSYAGQSGAAGAPLDVESGRDNMTSLATINIII